MGVTSVWGALSSFARELPCRDELAIATGEPDPPGDLADCHGQALPASLDQAAHPGREAIGPRPLISARLARLLSAQAIPPRCARSPVKAYARPPPSRLRYRQRVRSTHGPPHPLGRDSSRSGTNCRREEGA
jgi:hypothetical protein